MDGYYLAMEFRDSALGLLQQRTINFTRFCYRLERHHVAYQPQCKNHDTYVLTLSSAGT